MGHPDGASLNLLDVFVKFKACINGDSVLLPEYCEAYTEVSKLLMYFGNLFYFVTSDVSHKISELRALYAADTVNYKSVEQMVFYEEKQNEHLPVKKWRCTGCRTLLRLHRALLFVIDLMLEVCRVSSTGIFTHLIVAECRTCSSPILSLDLLVLLDTGFIDSQVWLARI
ncbi:Ceramide-1-phosphate transfer protein isoform 1 [Schistosoma japonicum]|uniref:Ceramide-1-phosphate transfer protein isoform 1 n=1 Tax=Schistosoma japonicum TaxID=6182 RepID=A0A4Z2D7P2_SCHJA|nr:Ceramide-1-phosphate transfer protein isoform 1 [Schistosoma japonicum]